MNSSTNIHSLSYWIVLMLLAASISLSKFAMSITEFLLLGMWLWSGFSFSIVFRFFKFGGFFKGIFHLLGYIIEIAYSNLIEKFTLLFRNKPVLIFLSIYIIHLIGLLYTSDMNYALKDLRVKLPLILLPVVISTMGKINSSRIRILLLVYSLAVFVSTFISVYLYFTSSYLDIREISPFISPIRLGLNVTFAFFIMLYFVLHDTKFLAWHKLIFTLLSLWFIAFLFLLESVTSIMIVVFVGVGYLLLRLTKTMLTWHRIVVFIFAISIPVVFFWHVVNIVVEVTSPPPIDFTQLEEYTPYGNKYIHDTVDLQVEDGKYIGLYLCYEEMRDEWNKRSNIDYNGITQEGHYLNATLIRYLTSKDLRKDKDGVAALTEEDVKMIELGLANYHYVANPGLRTRILKIIKGFEVYKETGNPSGSSVMQRIEYLRASYNIISDNFWTGVGTGDLEMAFNQQFNIMDSALEARYRYHAHNQFLGIFVALGVFGFLIFIIGLFYPAYKLKGFNDYFFGIFFIIMLISMFSDDTLETQAGVTLFAFFYSLLLFGRKIGDNFPAKIEE